MKGERELQTPQENMHARCKRDLKTENREEIENGNKEDAGYRPVKYSADFLPPNIN